MPTPGGEHVSQATAACRERSSTRAKPRWVCPRTLGDGPDEAIVPAADRAGTVTGAFCHDRHGRKGALRCHPALTATNPVTPVSAGEIASWRAVGGELLPRLWQHLRSRTGS